MDQQLPNWKCFSDLVSPQRAAEIFGEFYGAGAAGAAKECIMTADADNRPDDSRFWLDVLNCINLQRDRTPLRSIVNR